MGNGGGMGFGGTRAAPITSAQTMTSPAGSASALIIPSGFYIAIAPSGRCRWLPRQALRTTETPKDGVSPLRVRSAAR